MIAFNDIEKGKTIILDGQPYVVIESSFLFKGRGQSILKAKIKSLLTGNVVSKTFHPSDRFEEANITKTQAKFLYHHRDKYFFSYLNSSQRFELNKETIEQSAEFLKENTIVDALLFEDKIINITLPIKISLKVTEAPPGVKGDRSQAGTKLVTLETGAKILAPLFIEVGDIIEINTESKEYARRL